MGGHLPCCTTHKFDTKKDNLIMYLLQYKGENKLEFTSNA